MSSEPRERDAAYTVPIKLGESVIGWTTAEMIEKLGQASIPHLLIVPMPLEVLALRSHKRFMLVPQATITYITSLGGVVTAFADSGRYWTDQTLTQVE